MTRRSGYLTARDVVVLASGLSDTEISRRWRAGEGFWLTKGRSKLTRERAEKRGLEWVFFVEHATSPRGHPLNIMVHSIQVQREEPDAWLSELAERVPGGVGA
jgi:hypothetical protein